MPRLSTRLRWEQSDGRFRVAVFARNDAPGFRVESGFRGDRPASRSAAEEGEAIALAEGTWSAYQGGQIEAAPVSPETLLELINLVAEQPEHTAKTRRGYRQTWEQFAAWLGERHPRRIYPMDVRAYLEQYTGATRDRYLRELRAGFRWAIEQRHLTDDPTAGLKQTHKHEMGPWLGLAEWPAYLEACAVGHRIRSGFVLETGLREGELAAVRLDWLHGQVGRRAVRVAEDPRSSFRPKWGMARAVPLSERAERWVALALERWGGERGEDFLFSSAGLSALGNLARETRKAVAASGCTRTDFHGLRRSAGACWLEHGASLLEVSRLLGHRDTKTTERWYAGVSDRHLTEIVARVDASRASAPTPIRSARGSASSRGRGS